MFVLGSVSITCTWLFSWLCAFHLALSNECFRSSSLTPSYHCSIADSSHQLAKYVDLHYDLALFSPFLCYCIHSASLEQQIWPRARQNPRSNFSSIHRSLEVLACMGSSAREDSHRTPWETWSIGAVRSKNGVRIRSWSDQNHLLPQCGLDQGRLFTQL